MFMLILRIVVATIVCQVREDQELGGAGLPRDSLPAGGRGHHEGLRGPGQLQHRRVRDGARQAPLTLPHHLLPALRL